MTHSFPWLTALIILPLIGAAAVFFVRDASARLVALAVAVADLLISLPLWWLFDASSGNMQFMESALWISSPPIHYRLGLDGISLPLVLMTTVLMPLCILVSWHSIESRGRSFMAMLLIMEGAMIGVFSALDFVLFYVFWEAMLIPMYLLIGVWGGPNRLYAAIKFFLYTLAGSVLLLVAVLVLYFQGGHTFDILQLSQGTYSKSLQFWLFLAFFAAFAVKVPMFPLHTWLPDAHVEAPTAGSVILASVLLKMGTYGFLRFSLPMLPDASQAFTPLMVVLSIVGIVYGALVALAQKDWKRLVAYSSVSHMAMVMLGMFALNPVGITGSIVQQLNHGISTGALFLLVGVVYERRHTRLIAEYGGLSKVMPAYATIFLIMTMSSIGLPTLNGFIGELLILQGVFVANKIWAVFAASGVVLGAAYMLYLYQRTMFGKVENPKNERLLDLNQRELVTFAPLIALAVWIGLYPAPF